MEDKGFEREKELLKNEYFSDLYFDKYQLFSLSEQINLISKYSKEFNNPRIIEVGKGNGFVSDFFKKGGYTYTTFDINKNLEPDIEGNILEFSQLIPYKADIVVACEILEHLPLDIFEASIKEISEGSEKYAIITLPEFKKFYGFNVQIRLPKIKVFSLPLFIKYKGNKILGSGHFWEIDYDENSKRANIEAIIKKYFSIVEKGVFHTNPYHNYYILEKDKRKEVQ